MIDGIPNRPLYPSGPATWSKVASHNSQLASQADVVIDKSSEDWVPHQVSQTMSNINGHFRILNWRYLPYIRPM